MGLFTPVPDTLSQPCPTRFHLPWLRDRPGPSRPLSFPEGSVHEVFVKKEASILPSALGTKGLDH